MFLRFKTFYVRMESQRKQILLTILIFASLIGGYLLSRFQLNAPLIYGNIKPLSSSNLLDVSNERIEMRNQAIRALFHSKNSLSFCKHTNNIKSKGNNDFITSRDIHWVNMSSISKIIDEYFYRKLLFPFFSRNTILVEKATLWSNASLDRKNSNDGLLWHTEVCLVNLEEYLL